LAPWVKDIPEPDVVPDFMRALEAIQMQVTRIDAYTTCASEENIQNRFAELIRAKTASCLVFTSGAEIEVACKRARSTTFQPTALRLPVSALTQAAYARKKGLKVSIVAQDFSAFTGLATAIHQYYQNKK
jgi:uroporphyrinogen-III synthase